MSKLVGTGWWLTPWHSHMYGCKKAHFICGKAEGAFFGLHRPTTVGIVNHNTRFTCYKDMIAFSGVCSCSAPFLSTSVLVLVHVISFRARSKLQYQVIL